MKRRARRKPQRAPVTRNDGPTRETLAKLKPCPIAALFTTKRITQDEVRAAREIGEVYHAVCRASMCGSRDLNGTRGGGGLSDAHAWLHRHRWTPWARKIGPSSMHVALDLIVAGRSPELIALERRLPPSAVLRVIDAALGFYVSLMRLAPFPPARQLAA